MNEGQKQILSKGDLKRYKGGEEVIDESGSDLNNNNNHNENDLMMSPEIGERQEKSSGNAIDGPEEVSVVLNRGSRINKEFDILRFSKASSIDQNFMVDADHESRMGHYAK